MSGFNINEYIWVHLTQTGRLLVVLTQSKELFELDRATGFHKVQLWQWMALAGPRTFNGMDEPFTVDNEIYFSDPALSAAEAPAGRDG